MIFSHHHPHPHIFTIKFTVKAIKQILFLRGLITDHESSFEKLFNPQGS